MRTLESRLREKVESTEYQKDFKELKKSILLLRESKKHIRGIPHFIFVKVDPIKSQDAGVVYREKILLKELQGLLKKGNVNDHRIQIPDVYSDFKVEHRLRYLFDPAKPYPKFNPFDDKPLVASLPLDGGTKISMTVDISYPSRVLETAFKMGIRSLKDMWKLKEERKERYSDDDIYRAKRLDRQGLSDTDIFRSWFPKYKDFKFVRNYVISDRIGKETLDAVKKLQWIKRLVKKARERRV